MELSVKSEYTGQRQANTKEQIRAFVKECRRNLTAEAAERQNKKLLKHLISWQPLKAAGCVYCYISDRGEADTRELISWLWKNQIQIAVPRVEGKIINFYEIASWEDVAPGCMGILEPLSGCRRADDRAALVVTPGLAFDHEGRRIGYGGGYYDRFLAQEPEHRTIGLALDFQIFEQLLEEENDRRVDACVTPGGIFLTGKNHLPGSR